MDLQTMILTNSPLLRNINKGELAIKLLEMLTPQGSEFYNDPLRCYHHVKDRFDSNHKMILKLKKEINASSKNNKG